MQNFTIGTLTESIDNIEEFNIYNTAFEGFNVLTFKHLNSNELFFIGSQCANMLEYSDIDYAIKTHVSDEDKCKLDHAHCTKLMDLISNKINELVDPELIQGLTQNGANSLISNEINPNEINNLDRTENLNQSREDGTNSLNFKEIHKFNPKGAIFISEEGLYDLIFDSHKPEAKAFRKTVHRILKEIRTTGGYNLDKVPAVNYAESMHGVLEILSDQKELKSDLKNTFQTTFARQIGSYEKAIDVVGATTVREKISFPSKTWNKHTTIWTGLVNLSSYVHSQFMEYKKLKKDLKDTKQNLIDVKTVNRNAITALELELLTSKQEYAKEISELKQEYAKEISELKQNISELNHGSILLSQKIDDSLITNIDTLKEKINTLEEKMSEV